MYKIFTEASKKKIKFTLKGVDTKTTVVNLRELNLSDFDNDDIEIDDVVDHITDTLKENAPKVMFDAVSKKPFPDWALKLLKFIESTL